MNAQLASHRSDADTHNVVYALVDASLWQKLALSPGEPFAFYMNNANTIKVHFIALAEVNYIPSTYNAPVDPNSDVGIIVDYQSYATVYYLAVFLLGIGLGAMLIIFVNPAVTLLDLTGAGVGFNPYDVPPIQTIIPYPLISLLLAVLVIICLMALLLMARIVSRPSLSQTLRLNED